MMWGRRSVLWLIGVVTVATVVRAAPLPATAIVARVLKPDTFELAGGEVVRLIGVDAPIADPAQRTGDYYGRAGLEWMRDLIGGRAVRLRYGAQPLDPFGRLLAYVETPEGIDLNLELVQRGHAVAACFPPDTDRCGEFARAQQQAMQAQEGIWGIAGAATAPASDNLMLRSVRVARVIDGDTVQLDDGTIVRYLGVDAPESEVVWRKGAFGYDAWVANRSLVEGRQVLLEQDREASDSRGRALAWVWIDTPQGRELVNARLVEDGVAWVALFPPNTRHAARLFVAQRRAQEARRGMWAAK